MTKDLDKAQAEMDRLAAEAEELASEQRAIVKRELTLGAGATREQMQLARGRLGELRGELDRKREQIQAAHERVRSEIDRQTQSLRDVARRQQAALDAVLEPVQQLVERLEEGIETLSLYIGRGEQIFTIRDGQRAEATEPIVIRQMVLAMDEETGLLAEEEGINADNVEEFDAWLLANEEHVAQIVPERRCVVAMVPRWTARRRGDLRDADDTLTHFIIRNGEALFRTSVRFSAGAVLIPRAKEFVQFFYREQYDHTARQSRRVPLRPGSPEYQRALEKSDARSRHYLRIGLILQGLVDRTEIFAPLHPAGINMLSDPHERSEKVRIITDAEGGLESGEQSFGEWREQANAQLRVGMRIVGAFDGADFREANHRDNGRNERLNPSGWSAEIPDTGVPYVIEDEREDGALVIRYKRTEPVYTGHQARRRASCIVYRHDAFVLPYDAVDAGMLERFLRSRRNRSSYQSLWPLLRTVMLAKRAEEAAEAPFRQMLAGVLARDAKVSVSDAEAAVGELVRWFKLANRYHRPLVGTEQLSADEAKAVRLIVAEHKRRLGDRARQVDEEVVAALRAGHPEFLVIVRPRRRGYLVLEREDQRPVFVREHEYSAKGVLVDQRRWRLVGSRAERWLIVAQQAAWEGWDRMAALREHLTGPELEQLVEQIAAKQAERNDPLLAVTQHEQDGALYAWVVDEQVSFDPERPLTGELKQPSWELRTVQWKRKGQGPPTVWVPGYGSTLHITGDQDRPWVSAREGYYCNLVLFSDEQAVERYAEERRRYEDAVRFARPLQDLAERAKDSIRRAWVQQQTSHARERFLATGHEEDWPEHAATLDLEWPYDTHRFVAFADSELVTDRATDWALERGVWVHGLTLGAILDIAVKAGLRGGWVANKNRKEATRWDDDAIPELEEGVAGLICDLTAPADSDKEADERPDDTDEDHEEDEDELEGVEELASELRTRLVETLLGEQEAEDEVIATGPGYEVLDPEPTNDSK